MSAQKELLSIIKCLIRGKAAVPDVSVADWEAVIDLAQQQGLLVYVCLYANQLGEAERPDGEVMERLRRCYAWAVARDIRQTNAARVMRDAFEKNGISNLFFKGIVTKTRYKNPLLRSMGDIDFLYLPEQEAELRKVMDDSGFLWDHRGRVHDIYREGRDVLIEAHRQLLPSHSPYYSFCTGIWERVRRVEGRSFCFEMSLEDEVIFNIIHLASHFKKGGAGIRYILDAWVYHQLGGDDRIIEAELEKLNLDRFYGNVLLLAERWFGDAPGEGGFSVITEMESYILFGGIFGSEKNRADAVVSKGKARYLRKVVFPDYREMQSMFPWLKHRILLPCAWCLRGIESIVWRRGNIRALLRPVRTGNVQNKRLADFYSQCGLAEEKTQGEGTIGL